MECKKCTKCLKEKDTNNFRKRGKGLFSWCRDCENKENRKRYTPVDKTLKIEVVKSKDVIKHEAFKRMLKHRYNITYDTFIEMYNNQNGICGLCDNKIYLDKSQKVCIDHCHETGKIRSLLCVKCNTGLGMFNDNIELLDKAIKYIKRYKDS